MKEAISKTDSSLTIDYLTKEPENLYLERKDLRKKSGEIANELIGMLNSDGGILAYGISDDGEIQDVDSLSDSERDKYRTLHQRLIRPAPPIKLEEIIIDGKRIFIFHVREDNEYIYSRADSNQVYRRAGSSNYGPLTIEEIDNLRYDKNLRHYEDQTCEGFNPDDFDRVLLQEYKNNISFDGTDDEVLLYRNLAKRDKNGVIRYCNSAVLLFSQDPDKYIPSAYVRYTRYVGDKLETGTKFNITKDEAIRGNIPTVILRTREYLRASFKDYYSFNVNEAVFVRTKEYPEEAWLEGVVNAVFHRSYNLQGNCTMIRHFDDHIEISNSGPLPAQVNVNNIKEQRFSRNPRIGRVLYEMGYVRELNEGVKRIFESMSEHNLSEPIYSDQDSIVTLRLDNPIYLNEKKLSADLLEEISRKMASYNPTKKEIIDFLLRKGHGTILEISNSINMGERAVRNNLEAMMCDGIIVRKSKKQRDKNAIYVFKTEDK
ncbi:putative DNA binding domain-containing protein [Candidatus Saccharibacteria bacterium]|nr:putative DNA binding domain-containing protein [Candidatus Saccharibacteria bacterium]